MTTPRAKGFAMPAEWAPHARTWMVWPCRTELWGDRMDAARRTYAEVARALAQHEPVTMIARPELTAEASLQCGQGISVLPLDYDWRFNGYGEAAPAYDRDAALAEAICARLDVPRFAAPIVLEGGGLHVDGEGTCLVCAPSVVDPRRNPGLSRDAVAAVLADYLGITEVIWLEHGVEGDPSGGHVDNVACFVRPGVVMALASRDSNDANFAGLQDNLARLRGARYARGHELEVIEVEQAAARVRPDGRRMTMSYLNFYLANGAVLLPMFDDPMDDAAYKAIAEAFPDRQAIQIDAADLAYGGGGIHCITQQQPAIAE